jgi:hypothetical protein
VQEARPVLETLLNGRIVVTPDEHTGMFNVRIPLTTRGIFEGICGSQGVTSPTIASWNQIGPFLQQMAKLRERPSFAA